MKTFAGFQRDFKPVNIHWTNRLSSAKLLFEALWQKGGFHFWLAAYQGMLFDEKVNREAYNFWAKKT